MRTSVLLLAGLGLCSAAAAQSDSTGMELSPLQEQLPLYLFAPDPLAGTMLRPLSEAEPGLPPQGSTPGAPEATSSDTGAQPSATGALEPVTAEPEAAVTLEQPPQTGTEPPVGDPVVPAPPATDPAAPTPAATDPAAPDSAVTDPAAPAPGTPPADAGTTITVIVENVENADGTVNVAVCDKELSREGCPYDNAIKATPGFVETQFTGIPPGTYAVVGYHDENGNDEFDKFLGMPQEPYALSNRAAENLVPTFADAALTINEGENVVIIRLRRFGGG
jgi:uncharacterized protein (DUF2141 family)